MTLPAEIGFLAALVFGFLGSTHCIGMCGGIAGSLAVAAAPSSTASRFVYVLAYNAGRIVSYTFAGCLAALVGMIGLGFLPQSLAHGVAMTISVLFLVGLGSYLAGWWSFLPALESLGSRVWRRIEPWGRRLIPVKSRSQAFAFGLVWGWLPCGLVYSALAWAIATADPLHGMLLMLGFGLGTLPTVVCLGVAGEALDNLRRQPKLRQAAGVAMILFGISILILHQTNPPSHEHHQHQTSSEHGAAG